MGVISNTKEQFRKTKEKAQNFSFVSENWTTKKSLWSCPAFFEKTNFKDCFVTSLWFEHFVSSFMEF